VLAAGLNVVVCLQRRNFNIAHVVLIYGISSNGKNFKIKDSGENRITEIPINRLSFYQNRVLEQDENYFSQSPGQGFNLSQHELKKRLLSNLKNKNSSLDIDFDQTDEWMINDTGYCLRFNKINNLPSEVSYENSSEDSFDENSDENLTENSDEENSDENPEENLILNSIVNSDENCCPCCSTISNILSSIFCCYRST